MKFLSFDGPIMNFLSRVADLFWLNILYIICCLPIFTIGAATTALYYVTMKMVKEEDGYLTKAFFKSFKENFKQATIIWFFYGLIFGIAISDMIFVNAGLLKGMLNGNSVSNVVKISVLVTSILIFVSYLYVFPLLAKFENTVINTIKNSFIIGIRHLPSTLAMIVITVVPFAMMIYSVKASVMLILVFSVVAYLNSLFFCRIFPNYMPKTEETSEGEEGLSEILADEVLVKPEAEGDKEE